MALHIHVFFLTYMMTTVSGHSTQWQSILTNKEEMCCGDCTLIVVTVVHVLFAEEDTGSFSNEASQVHTTPQYMYFNFSTCFGQLCAHHQENSLYLCDTGVFRSVWVAVRSFGWNETLIPTSRPDSHPYKAKNISVAQVQ